MARYDLIAIGELLADFISTEFASTFEEAATYRRLMGGSPANVCLNLAYLGKKPLMVATVGKDDIGNMFIQNLENAGVNTACVTQVKDPTTLILVTRSRAVSNFEAYRLADTQITPSQVPHQLFAPGVIYHTTCFGLSRQPARDTILDGALLAFQAGCQLSIDLNYAAKIWPIQSEAQAIVQEYCAYKPLVKVSEVDWQRLYNTPVDDPEVVLDHFLALGARAVCLTLGDKGLWVADRDKRYHLEARPVAVMDTTGAGDAFWAGFLVAWVEGRQLLNCAKAGRAMAEYKLRVLGPISAPVDKVQLFAELD